MHTIADGVVNNDSPKVSQWNMHTKSQVKPINEALV